MSRDEAATDPLNGWLDMDAEWQRLRRIEAVASRYRAAEWAIHCNEDAIRDEAHNARVEEWRAADAALAALLGESSPFRPTPSKASKGA